MIFNIHHFSLEVLKLNKVTSKDKSSNKKRSIRSIQHKPCLSTSKNSWLTERIFKYDKCLEYEVKSKLARIYTAGLVILGSGHKVSPGGGAEEV